MKALLLELQLDILWILRHVDEDTNIDLEGGRYLLYESNQKVPEFKNAQCQSKEIARDRRCCLPMPENIQLLLLHADVEEPRTPVYIYIYIYR